MSEQQFRLFGQAPVPVNGHARRTRRPAEAPSDGPYERPVGGPAPPHSGPDESAPGTPAARESDVPAPAERSSSELARLADLLERMEGRLAALEGQVDELRELLVTQRTVKDWYSTQEVAKLLGKSAYTVREWCRLERLAAEKAQCGRGAEMEWRISHEELERYRNQGLRPSRY